MSSTDTLPETVRSYRLQHLSETLRRANARYRSVAASIRRSLRPTHHGRVQALNRGLAVDVKRAAKCPQRHISVVPLPIIDTTPSPVTLLTIRIPSRLMAHSMPTPPESHPPITKQQSPLRCGIPSVPSMPTSKVLSSDKVAAPLEYAKHPRLPPVFPGRDVPWRGLTSSWSANSGLAESPSSLVRTSSGSDGIFDLLGSVHSQTIPLEVATPDGDFELQYPSPESSNSVGDAIRFFSHSPDLARSDTTSSLESYPTTPYDMEPEPIMLRIKRKSPDPEDNAETGRGREKRPKLARKDWVLPATRYRVFITSTTQPRDSSM